MDHDQGFRNMGGVFQNDSTITQKVTGSDCAEFGHSSRAIALQMARNEPQAAPTGGKQSHEPTLDASQPPRA